MHFAINIIAALIFFAIFWLYFDAWLGRRKIGEAIRYVGFLLISFSFVLSALYIESSVLVAPIINQEVHIYMLILTRLFGYLMIIIALKIDPLMKKPKRDIHSHGVVPLGAFFSIKSISFTFPILAGFIGFLYLKRSTIGLENHLKPLALSFFLISFSEILSLGYLLRGSNNSIIYEFVAPYSALWVIQSLVVLLSVIVLRKWLFGYLLKRIQSQLFMIFVSSTVALFLIITLVFSALMIRNIERETLASLTTDVNMLRFAIDSKKAEVVSDAQLLALNPELADTIEEENKSKLKSITTSTLLAKKQSIVTVLNDEGVVLSRGEDSERIGDSLSSDVLVGRALKGEDGVSIVTRDGVLAPIVSVKSAVPVKNGDQVIGVVVVGNDIDNAFVDGIKTATGLNVSVYADQIRSATTFIAPDGKTRWIGIKEQSEEVRKTVLMQGKLFSGTINILNIDYLGAVLPIKDIDNTVVGMLFVGKEKTSLLQAAGRSIELTFLATVVILILTILPAFFISRYISNQLK
jgi:hypothetical protein